jgi:hypothetical protein
MQTTVKRMERAAQSPFRLEPGYSTLHPVAVCSDVISELGGVEEFQHRDEI